MKLTYMLCLVFEKILGKMRCEQNKEIKNKKIDLKLIKKYVNSNLFYLFFLLRLNNLKIYNFFFFLYFS